MIRPAGDMFDVCSAALPCPKSCPVQSLALGGATVNRSGTGR